MDLSTISLEEIKRSGVEDEHFKMMNRMDKRAELNKSQVQGAQLKPNSYECDDNGHLGKKTKLTTKSVENILEPKLYDLASTPPGKKSKKPNMTHISDKIKTMSSRTQKLFARIYSSAPKQVPTDDGWETSEHRMPFGMKAATCRIKTPKSRRSLSFGNIPSLEDFKQVLKEIDHLNDGDDIKPPIHDPNTAFANATLELAGQQRLHDEVKGDLLDECEDTDSGIMVNESGQSSIIETDEILLSDGNGARLGGVQKLAEATMTAQDVNANIEFKFVRLRIDATCGLGIGIKSITTDSSVNRRVGYQVATVTEGGMVHRWVPRMNINTFRVILCICDIYFNREGTIKIGDEIVNISGRSVRGISMHQVRDLLERSYNNKDETDIDLVICRYGISSKPKLRKKSIHSYLNDLDDSPGGEFNEFASSALK